MIHESADKTAQYKRGHQDKKLVWLQEVFHHDFTHSSAAAPPHDQVLKQLFRPFLLVQHISKLLQSYVTQLQFTLHISGAWARRTPAKISAWAPAWSSLGASSTPYLSHQTSVPSFVNLTTTVSSGELAGMEHSAIFSAATISM